MDSPGGPLFLDLPPTRQDGGYNPPPTRQGQPFIVARAPALAKGSSSGEREAPRRAVPAGGSSAATPQGSPRISGGPSGEAGASPVGSMSPARQADLHDGSAFPRVCH